MYIHVVDRRKNEIIPPEDILKVVDDNIDTLSKVYSDAGIQKIIPAASSEEITRGFGENIDPNLAALIALLITLFIGVILFSILCCCIRNWAIAQASAKASKPQRLAPGKQLKISISSMGGGEK
jgi:hypothetical protein